MATSSSVEPYLNTYYFSKIFMCQLRPTQGSGKVCLIVAVGHGGRWRQGFWVFGVENYWAAWAGAMSNPIAFVAFVVEVVPPHLQGKGGRTARALPR